MIDFAAFQSTLQANSGLAIGILLAIAAGTQLPRLAALVTWAKAGLASIPARIPTLKPAAVAGPSDSDCFAACQLVRARFQAKGDVEGERLAVELMNRALLGPPEHPAVKEWQGLTSVFVPKRKEDQPPEAVPYG